MAYIPDMDGYVFHGGYCVVYTDDRERCGLMDMTGRIVLPLEFNDIIPIKDLNIWQLKKDLEYGVLDKDLKPIIPLMECNSMYISEGTINVTMPDHNIRNYDMQGTPINDFYITSVRMLEYEKEEIVYRRNTVKQDEEFDVEEFKEFYHPKATASLRAYVAGDGYEGLVTADGHRVTMPLYWEIESLDHDLYLCSSKNEDKVIVDSKGEIVKQ